MLDYGRFRRARPGGEQRMMSPVRFSRRTRWAVPAGAVAVVGLVAAGIGISAGAQAAPALPARSAAQLLAGTLRAIAAPPPAMTATVSESAALGFPSLPGNVPGAPTGLSLLSGSNTVKIWYADPAHVRIAVPVPMGETDLRVNGRQVWLWRSSNQTATRVLLPAAAGFRPLRGPGGGHWAAGSVPTPGQAARQILAAVGPTTAVSVQQNVMVAGQAAYQLRIAPRTSRSLIGQIRIAIDAANYLPLQLQVFARGAASPAFTVGYTALSFGRPSASNFTFTPPPGAKVRTVRLPGPGVFAGLGVLPAFRVLPGLPGGLPGRSARVKMVPMLRVHGHVVKVAPGTPGKVAVPMPRGKLAQLRIIVRGRRRLVWRALAVRAALRNLPKLRNLPGCPLIPLIPRRHVPPAQHLAVPRHRCGVVAVGGRTHCAFSAASPNNGGVWCNMRAPVPAVGPTVLGHGWLSVLVLPAAGAAIGPVNGTTFSAMAQDSAPAAGQATYSSSEVISPTPGALGPAGAGLAVLGMLQRAAVPVHGSWGSGRLLRTSLVSVLFTGDGKVLAGAVTPAVLYADAAKLK
jgi:hypothetical protein